MRYAILTFLAVLLIPGYSSSSTPKSPANPMEDAINRAWAQVAAMEKDFPAISGFSQNRPTFKHDKAGLVEAQLQFSFNATPYTKSLPSAEDKSKPYCYLMVSVWRPNNLPGQPTFTQRKYRIGATTLEGDVNVFCSDSSLAEKLRTIFESRMAEAEGKTTGDLRATPGRVRPVARRPSVSDR
jgi:hypothetical protein